MAHRTPNGFSFMPLALSLLVDIESHLISRGDEDLPINAK
jgi:hypothetical protein